MRLSLEVVCPLEGRAGSAAGNAVAGAQPQCVGITKWHSPCWFARLKQAKGSSEIHKEEAFGIKAMKMRIVEK